MAFTQKSFGPISSHGNSDMPNIWTYRTPDNKATVNAVDYFIKKLPVIGNGDFINVDASDGKYTATFTVIGGTIQVIEPSAITAIRPVYGTMAITQRDINDGSPNNITVLAHPSGNSTLNPPSAPVAGTSNDGPFGGYYKISAFIQEGSIKELTIANGEFTVPNDGVYIVPIGWSGFRHTANNATIGFVIGIERAGQMIFSQRPTSSKQPNLGDIENVSGGGQVTALAGDKISAWLASDTNGDITVGNSNFTIHMLEDTT